MPTNTVQVINAALDIAPDNSIILRGVIVPATLQYIKADDYQREVLPLTAHRSLFQALRAGTPIPDIVLGMRGGDFTEGRNGTWMLNNPVYVIDGLQRISAARHLLCEENVAPRLGATIHFNTHAAGENELFKSLNTRGVKLSRNILLRNLRRDSAGIQVLAELSEDVSSPLYDRVCWSQRQRRREILPARTLLQTATYLHNAFVASNASHSDLAVLSLDRLVNELVGRKIAYQNLRGFYEVVDECWGIRAVTYAGAATHLRSRFLNSLARFFSLYRDFWDESRRFTVPPDLRRKLRIFPINDPLVKALAGSSSNGSPGGTSLITMLSDHINSGKRTKRLTPFKQSDEQKGTNSNA